MKAGHAAQYAWRKLASGRWEDAWVERLTFVADRLAITALAGRKTIRLQAFGLRRAEAMRLQSAFGGEVAVQKRVLPTECAKERAPIRIRRKLLVVSNARQCAAMAPRADDGPALLFIPAGMAFGTGDHATTATCLRLLADVSVEMAKDSWEMLDLGTGTGILAIAARKLGARGVEAADFDPAAIRVAKENVRANALNSVRVRKLDVRDWQPERTWPVIAANLYSEVLIAAAPRIAQAAAPQCELILSGILLAQAPEVLAAFAKLGFAVHRAVPKGKWFSVRLRRR